MKYKFIFTKYAFPDTQSYNYSFGKITINSKRLEINTYGVYYILPIQTAIRMQFNNGISSTLKWYPELLQKLSTDTIPSTASLNNQYDNWSIQITLLMAMTLLKNGIPKGMYNVIYVPRYKTYRKDGLAKFMVEDDKAPLSTTNIYTLSHRHKYCLVKGVGKEVIFKR